MGKIQMAISKEQVKMTSKVGQCWLPMLIKEIKIKMMYYSPKMWGKGAFSLKSIRWNNFSKYHFW